MAPAAFAQAKVDLTVQTPSPYVGQPLSVQIRVQNAREVEVPEFPRLSDCSTQYVGEGSKTNIVTDRGIRHVAVEKTFQFVLTPRNPGELVIPAISVVADGETLTTEPVRVTVRERPQSASPRGARGGGTGDSQTSDLLLAEISCAQSKLYVGQRVRFTLTIFVKPAEYNGQPLSRSDMFQFLECRFGPFDPRSAQSSTVTLPREDGPDQTYYAVELPAEFVVEQAGPLTFSDVAIGMDYPTRISRDRWGFLEVAGRRKLPPLRPVINTPEVLPLPTEGRPANFSGAVGRYTLSAFAVPSNVRVGDPIKLVIDISGDRVETLPGPDLAGIAQLVEDFRVPNETLAGTVRGNSKRFTQTIRAKRPDVKDIPPIEFAYFDPDDEKYVVARSEPIPVLVSVVEQLDAADLADITTPSAADQGHTLQARDGLRGNQTAESRLLATVKPVTMTQVALATLVPPIVFGCIWSLAALTRSGRDESVRRRRAALRNAERRIQGAVDRRLPPRELHTEIEAALAGYLADRLNEPPGRFLGSATVAFLEQRGVDADLVRRCRELLERCEQTAYAGDSDGDVSLADLARQCARQLEKERL